MELRRTLASHRRLGLAPLAVMCLSSIACSGGDDEPAPPTMDEALDELECTPVDPDGWEGAAGSLNGVRCDIEGTWPARVRAELSAPDHADLVGALSDRYDASLNDFRCADGSISDPVLVAGDGWIVLVSDAEGARHVRDVLGGQVVPGSVAGPPVSQPSVPCTGDPWP